RGRIDGSKASAIVIRPYARPRLRSGGRWAVVDAARNCGGVGAADSLVRCLVDRVCWKRLRRFHPVAPHAVYPRADGAVADRTLLSHGPRSSGGGGGLRPHRSHQNADSGCDPSRVFWSFALAVAGIVATLRTAFGG